MAWDDRNVPDQHGRTALVTGGTGGLGLSVARVLASRGARVIVAGRDEQRGESALERIREVAVDAEPLFAQLDMADLATVRRAADDIRAMTDDRIDILVNNAGIMAPPLGFSADGFELQWATNVIGPALLAWGLLPAIENVPESRVVWVSSLAHWGARLDPERIALDLAGVGYRRTPVYGRTKLADLLLSRELERRFLRTDAEAISVAAHPGVSSTGLIESTAQGQPRLIADAMRTAIHVGGQPPEQGALPLLFAATAPGVRGSQYFGPSGLFELRGEPNRAARSPASRSDEQGRAVLDAVEARIDLPLR